MILQLLALAAASDASDSANRAANIAQEGVNAINSNRRESHFLMFEELDFHTHRSGFMGIHNNNDGKYFTKRSIPLSRIKEVVEINSKDLRYSGDDEGYTQGDRIKEFHDGVVTIIKTFDGVRYYLDTTLEEFHKVIGVS
jgi:hypothetical protein